MVRPSFPMQVPQKDIFRIRPTCCFSQDNLPLTCHWLSSIRVPDMDQITNVGLGGPTETICWQEALCVQHISYLVKASLPSCVNAKLPQSCPILCDPMDCSLGQILLSMEFSSQKWLAFSHFFDWPISNTCLVILQVFMETPKYFSQCTNDLKDLIFAWGFPLKWHAKFLTVFSWSDSIISLKKISWRTV